VTVEQRVERPEAATRPMNGEEYLDSLRDGREIYVYGERVEDVTTHPAFRNGARSIARLYDALHDPEEAGALTCPTDTGNGGVTHHFFRVTRSADDLLAARDAIVAWQRKVYGFMGRTPDYKAGFLSTLGANADFYAPFEENARRWYREAQERVLYLNHAIVHPPIDRDKPADETADVCVHVERETDQGLIVSGAKVVATASALTNYNFVAHYGIPVRDKAFGVVFMLPMNARGLKLLARTSYEMTAAVMGSPFDYPLSSRLDENDSILILDQVLVPWENVFMFDADKANSFLIGSGSLPRLIFHGCTRLAVKLDFIAGCALKGVHITGTSKFRGVKALIGEILGWRNVFWGLSDAMAKSPKPWIGESVQPNPDYGLAYRMLMTIGYPRVKELIQQSLGSGLIYLNSHASDWSNEEIRPYLDRYLRGSDDIEAVDRVKLLKLLWDAVGTEFGGRHELYERNYSGDHESVRFQILGYHQSTGDAAALEGFAEECMAEYDLDGWTADDLVDADDVRFPFGDLGRADGQAG
jgi:4-hydroxyphenylacetate 3-monooxygenase